MVDSEEQMNAARQEKQLFLKAEIIDEGYSGADFAEFLDSKKAEGTIIHPLITSRRKRYRSLEHGRAAAGTKLPHISPLARRRI
jgi:hypothetical protein